MCKKLPNLVELRIGVGILFLTVIAASARADEEDDRQAKFLQAHPNYHGFLTPHPPYPLQARMTHDHGSVRVQITFAAGGKVEDVAILKSSGSQVLDSKTTYYIKRYWRNLTGKRVVHAITQEYSLR